MLRRLLLGVVVGLVCGGLLAAGLVRLFGTSFVLSGGGALAYLSAAVAGAVTGLFAGKPIWASGAKVEAGLKALFGALMAAGAMYGLRRWGAEIPTPAVLGGTAPVGELPAVSIPLIAAGLGALFGLDSSVPDPADPASTGPRKRVGSSPAAASGAAGRKDADDSDDAADLDPRRARR